MDDPNWSAIVPNRTAADSDLSKRPLPPHEDCSPLDVDAAAGHLEPGGTLGRMPGYEARPGQVDMLRAIVRSFNDRRHLMVEAGTGVGKSLAYLVPSVLWSFTNDTPVVISTATRNLQSQLLNHDLPRAAQILGPDAPRLRIAVLKGRTNYLCLRALGEFMQNGYFALTEQEQTELVHLVEWLRATPDGDLDALGADALRPHVCCQSEDCQRRSCPYAAKCFVYKARARANRAHVIVANHALVLAEAANGAGTVLPAYGRLVFDEAHNLEDMATDFFSHELSRPALLRLLGRLSRMPKSRHGRGEPRGVLGSLDRQLRRGVFRDPEHAAKIRGAAMQAQTQSVRVIGAYDELADIMGDLFIPAPREEILRYRRCPDRQYSLHGLFTGYPKDRWKEERLQKAAIRLESELAQLQSAVESLAAIVADAAALEDRSADFDDVVAQAKGLVSEFAAFKHDAKFILDGSDPSHVYWAERCDGGKSSARQPYVRLVAAPLSVAKEMKRCFYDVKDTVVLCSATLRTGDKFDYMARKLGLNLVDADRIKALVAASPFDYFRQALVMSTSGLPDPASQPGAYVERLVPFIAELFRVSRGRGLVLFTSYDMMRTVAERARPLLEAAGVALIVQGEGTSREAMTAALKNAGDRRVVLFGAQSFWEGVDVPGPALSCVVLARLPFPQVGEPIVEARCEKIVENGGSQFRDFMLPEAIIRFRQGFGRLVRTKTDSGVVVIADSRMATKNYGPIFRKSIAASVHMVSDVSELVARAGEFFNQTQP